jgi:tellurite resistance protein TerA
MFEIKSKNQSALLASNFTQLMVNLNWTSAVDFDLFAVYETKTGKVGIIYYGDQGDLNRFPYMQLSDDAGQGDEGGDNQETMIIAQLTEMKYVWVCAWDYNQVERGSKGRFDRCDLNMTVISDKGEFKVPLDSNIQGNTALVLTIDNTNPIVSSLINSSEVTTLQGLNSTQLVSFLKSSVPKS